MIINPEDGIDQNAENADGWPDRQQIDAAAAMIRESARRMLAISGAYLSDDSGD